jgi:uncharacterized membrane protein YcfT
MNGSSTTTAGDPARPVNERRDWIDVAKGLSIVLVVLMHSTLGVEAAFGREGWLHPVVAFAEPFRIPTFFLVAGLFAARAVDAPWRRTLDGKVLHFAYFYLLWMSLQYAIKSGPAALRDPAGFAGGWLHNLVEPLGTLWFIHLLPLFFVAARLLRRAPPLLVIGGATLLALAPVHTGWTTLDEFAARFVFFVAGWLGAPVAFELAARAAERAGLALLLVAAWAVFDGALVLAGPRASPPSISRSVLRGRSRRSRPPRSPCASERTARSPSSASDRSWSTSPSSCRWRRPDRPSSRRDGSRTWGSSRRSSRPRRSSGRCCSTGR